MIDSQLALDGLAYRFSRDFRHARGQVLVPVVASELFNVAGEAAILFARRQDGWDTVAVIGGAGPRSALVDEDGAWTGDYSPMMLRLHPFLRPDALRPWQVDPVGLLEAGQGGVPFATADGATAEFLRVQRVLEEADQGRAHLAGAAAALHEVGALTPLAVRYRLDRHAPELDDLFCVDWGRLAGLSPRALSRLVDGDPSSLDLATASLHSMRFLAAVADRAGAELAAEIFAIAPGGGTAAAEAPAEPQPRTGYALDTSDMIDFANLT